MFFFLKHIFNAQFRRTKHFQEWFKVPKNYVRLKEFLFIEQNLKSIDGKTILDIASPKWLSYKLLHKNNIDLIISDFNDYFFEDFEIFIKEIKSKAKIEIFDTRNIPLKDSSIDIIFSVSVLEHIPFDGDIKTVDEFKRVLNKGGIALITLPAYKYYIEEWVKNKKLYWDSIENENGEIFYQRRYDKKSILNRFNIDGLKIDNVIYIAEKPIAKPFFNENNMLVHNAHLINSTKLMKIMNKIDNRFLPLTQYLIHKFYSWRFHYFTQDDNDPNIRQVCIKFIKE